MIGGEFESVGEADRSNLASVDLRSGAATPWDPKAEGVVEFLGSEPRGLVRVGGEFDSVGAVARSGLAELSTNGSQLLPFAPAVTGPVRALAIHDRISSRAQDTAFGFSVIRRLLRGGCRQTAADWSAIA